MHCIIILFTIYPIALGIELSVFNLKERLVGDVKETADAINASNGDSVDIDDRIDIYKTPRFPVVPGAAGLLKRHGYQTEIHNVITEDGYILQMERIIGNYATATNCPRKKRAALLMHGIFDSSATWIITGPNNSLATQLTDLCYDVWLGNARGNRYSRRHKTLNPDGNRKERRDFWSFSWHEIGYYDLPAMIDYILNASREFKKIAYVGHSQGTTSFFVMTSLRPEYNDKIQLANCLAPIGTTRHITAALTLGVFEYYILNEKRLTRAGRLETLSADEPFTNIQRTLCASSFGSVICENVFYLIMGYNPELFNRTAVDDVAQHIPAGASAIQFIHYGQLRKTDGFRSYDYGAKDNVKRYNSEKPPLYPTQNIVVPIILYYSKNDLVAVIDDVEIFARQLPNVVRKYVNRHDKFNHIDFTMAENLRHWLNDDIVREIELADSNE